MQQYKKKAEELSVVTAKLDSAELALEEKEEVIRTMEIEAAFFKQSKDTIKALRDEIAKSKVQISQLEHEVHSANHALKDTESQLVVLKKKDEQNLDKISKLNLQLEEYSTESISSTRNMMTLQGTVRELEQSRKLRSEPMVTI